MKVRRSILALLSALLSAFLSLSAAMSSHAAPAEDPYLWLEDVHDKDAMNWVDAQNALTFRHFDDDPLYKALLKDALDVLESPSRLPDVTIDGDYVYNLWQDGQHPRGIYRRATIASFASHKPQWQTVLDIDTLSSKEGKEWAFSGMACLPPEDVHCMIGLAPGGRDAAEHREFNTQTLSFVDRGFFLPLARASVSWIDQDTLYVETDFGADSLTRSGYPRTVHVWRRGTQLEDATLLYTADPSSVAAAAFRLRSPQGNIDLLDDSVTFWRSHRFLVTGDKLTALDLPDTAQVEGAYKGQLVISLKADWTRGNVTYPDGAVLLAEPKSLQGQGGDIQLLVNPTRDEVVESIVPTFTGVLVTLLDDVRGRLYRYTLSGQRVLREAIAFPDNGAVRIAARNVGTGDAFIEYESFLTPPTLYYLPGHSTRPTRVMSQAATFDATPFSTRQYWTTSSDGTRIPYFVVGRKDLQFNGKNPVWMFSYGGFENSLTPSYSGSYEDLKGAYGKLWLARGGVFVLANIRGGGEFGPGWHTQALKAGHIKSIEDFEAVARDLSTRKITSSAHIGIEGRSNGGLLVAATMLRHPELYGAVVCGSPLLDMKRYTRLGVGASWIAEYGDPEDPNDWAFIKTYSPYQNVLSGKHYPPVFFYSATSDDRVHPGHARKMVARMESLGYDVYYYENTEGGHHGGVTPAQFAKRIALTYTFLWEHVK